MENLKNQLTINIEKILAELEKGNDVIIKKGKDGIKIQSIKVKTIS